jgi:hypothetical protein
MNDQISAAQCLLTMSGGAGAGNNSYSLNKEKDELSSSLIGGGEQSDTILPRNTRSSTFTRPPAPPGTRGTVLGTVGGVLMRESYNYHEEIPTHQKEESKKKKNHTMIISPSTESQQCHDFHKKEKECSCSCGEQDKNFILDLFLVISDNQANYNSSIAAWLPSGNSFMILDEYKFASLIVPVLLGEGADIQDFVLELYKWGFESTEPYSPSSTNVLFWHEFFKKDHQHMLHKIVPVLPPAAAITHPDPTSLDTSNSYRRRATIMMINPSSSSFTTSTSRTKPRHVSFDGDVMSGSSVIKNYNFPSVSSTSSSSSLSRASEKKRRHVSFEEQVTKDSAFIPALKKKKKSKRMNKKKSVNKSAPSPSFFSTSKRNFLTEEEDHHLSLSVQPGSSAGGNDVSSFERRSKMIKNAVGSACSIYNEDMKKRHLQIKQDPNLYQQVMEARFERFMSNRRQVFFFQKENQSIPIEDELLQAAHPTSHAKRVIGSAFDILRRGDIMDRVLE